MHPTVSKTSSIPFYWPFKGVFYGWAVVWTSVLVSFAQVPMYGPVLSVFVEPIGNEMGWSRAQLSIAFTVGSLFGSLLSSIVGRQLDRYGARVSVVAAGMIITGALVGLALMQQVWEFWVFFGIGRTAALAGVNLGTSVAVSNWFIRKRGRTVSFLGIGLRAGQAIFPLFLSPIIVFLSYRYAYGVLAVIWFVLIVIPAWLFIRRRPEDLGLLPDGDLPEAASTFSQASNASPTPNSKVAEDSWTLAEARRTLAFWLLILATMIAVFAQTAVNLHAVASLQDRGVGGAFAGVFVFLFAGTAAASAYGWGVFMDKFHVRTGSILATTFTASSIVALIFADNVPMAVLFALLFGLGVGGWTLSQTLLFANYFGRRYLGSIRGMAQVISGPVGAVGPVLAGYLRDVTKSYTLAFEIFFVAFLLVIVALFFARPPKRIAQERSSI